METYFAIGTGRARYCFTMGMLSRMVVASIQRFALQEDCGALQNSPPFVLILKSC